MRSFIAFPIPENSKSLISEAVENVRRKLPEVKWVKGGNFHITLLFLGEIDEAGLTKVIERCRSTASLFAPFEASFYGFGQFPPKGAPRVIYTPIVSGEKECRAVYGELQQRIARIVSVDTRKYSPHITLGRINRGRRTDSVNWKKLPLQPKDIFKIDRFILYESVLQSSGPVYNELRSFVLQS